MKRSHIGPRSNQTLDQAQSAIARVNDLCTRRKNTSAAASVDKQAARMSDRARSLPELTDYANGELFQQFHERLNYLLGAKVATMYDNVVTTGQGLHALNAMDKPNTELMRLSFVLEGATATTGTASLPTTNKKTSMHSRLRKASSPVRKKRAVSKSTL